MYKNGAKGVSAKTCSGNPHSLDLREGYFAQVFKTTYMYIRGARYVTDFDR